MLAIIIYYESRMKIRVRRELLSPGLANMNANKELEVDFQNQLDDLEKLFETINNDSDAKLIQENSGNLDGKNHGKFHQAEVDSEKEGNRKPMYI